MIPIIYAALPPYASAPAFVGFVLHPRMGLLQVRFIGTSAHECRQRVEAWIEEQRARHRNKVRAADPAPAVADVDVGDMLS